MGDLFVKLTAYALKVQKQLVIENLDFQKKKRELRESSSKQARMLSGHHGAALCIARRTYGFPERPPRFPGKIPDGKGGHVALSLPARNRGKHVWSRWRALSKRLRKAYAERFRAKRNRSAYPPIAGSRVREALGSCRRNSGTRIVSSTAWLASLGNV